MNQIKNSYTSQYSYYELEGVLIRSMHSNALIPCHIDFKNIAAQAHTCVIGCSVRAITIHVYSVGYHGMHNIHVPPVRNLAQK